MQPLHQTLKTELMYGARANRLKCRIKPRAKNKRRIGNRGEEKEKETDPRTP